MSGLLRHRINRSLMLLALGASAAGSLLLATVSSAIVLQVTVGEAQKQARAVETDLISSLTSFQPLYEVQRQLQIAASSSEARSALVIDGAGRVIAASDSALVGRSVRQLGQDQSMGDLPRHLKDCLDRRQGVACLHGDALSFFDGPLPWIGGDHLIRFTPTPLALEGLPAFGERATLVIEVDLQRLVAQAGRLALVVFLVGLLPLFLTAGALVLILRRNLLPELLALAQTDSLSGIYNRRAFLETASQRLELHRSVDQPCVVALIDIDHFKAINDSLGHAAGDEVIRLMADFFGSAVRRSDLVGRLGGDEFGLLIGASGAEAFELLERLRLRVASQNWTLQGGVQAEFTLSIGMVCADSDHTQQLSDLLQDADAALYVAKDQGRNQVVDLTSQPSKGWRIRLA
jgi:diguanylate cyclase (GGDEF)-like protein